MDDDGARVPPRGVSAPAGGGELTARGPERLDDLDLRIVVALQRDGRASWRAIAELVDHPVTTVVRHGQQLLADGLVRITAAPALGARGRYDNFMVRIRCRPGTQVAVAEAISRRPDVRFCAMVTGEDDIVAELVVDGGAAAYPFLLAELRAMPEIERWRSALIMHVYKARNDWGRQLVVDGVAGEELLDEELGRPVECDPSHLDETDWRILDVLGPDGRQTFQSVADQLGISETSVRRRFERMRQARCVDILVLVPSALLGMEAETLMTVDVDPSALEDVARLLAHHPSVRYVAALLDRNALLCEVITPRAAGLYEFATKFLAQCAGVKGWSSSVELLNLKRGFVETPWWRHHAYSATEEP